MPAASPPEPRRAAPLPAQRVAWRDGRLARARLAGDSSSAASTKNAWRIPAKLHLNSHPILADNLFQITDWQTDKLKAVLLRLRVISCVILAILFNNKSSIALKSSLNMTDSGQAMSISALAKSVASKRNSILISQCRTP
jgi:hypothetical protein